jgi:very-short-patch-repair endonuclease
VRILESLGFRVVRVTNLDIFDNLPGVLDLIFSELNP